MAVAIVLLIIVIASVVFHFVNPWTLTELASNWSSMDAMLQVSFAVTGIVFVAVSLFLVLAIFRYRHRPGHRARFSPDNRRLEWWLLGITSVGIMALLAPGLVVYYDFIRTPDNAMTVEVVGEQWRFSYRYPGPDGELGAADVRRMSSDNPLGLDPDDPAGQDDVVVVDGPLRLPVDRPVRVVMRSKDVLHNVFVPQFRAKMDMVPGMVTQFWFTPTRAGEFEMICAQHCGVGHFNMRGSVQVLEPDAFDTWLAQQDSFGVMLAALDARVEDPEVARGRGIAEQQGCLACHSVDGSRRVGPTWLNLYGSEVTLADDSVVTADDAYLRRSITDPRAELTKGYPPAMPAYDFEDDVMDALVAYIQSLADSGESADAQPAPDDAD
ncbi:cytochrome c oxidase subunit 2 [Natronocella acetinitrilica]|uniref:cytochrome-c oxidase n=1 Tax=Natronocella acetinitrilica TaxID=414046 RepID=A0AAE3KAQ3_9GAMM|nr:cytochrome c oxidase subunit II [Natronocella acetinitrilica]MCP1674645.1 cytochrome c oxidase subunit 2 [Natronocella acetinitrilica]